MLLREDKQATNVNAILQLALLIASENQQSKFLSFSLLLLLLLLSRTISSHS